MPFLPNLLFAIVQALQSRGESVACLVRQIDRVVQVGGPHHGQHRSKELRHVRKAARLHIPFDRRRNEVRIGLRASRHQGPRFALLQLHQRLFQHSGGRLDQRSQLRLRVPGRSDRQTFRGVAECLPEGGVLKDLLFQDQQ